MVQKVRPRCCFNGRVDGEAVGKGRHSAKCLEVAKDRELHAKRGGEASARVETRRWAPLMRQRVDDKCTRGRPIASSWAQMN
jgi:hypothetical protein